MLRACVLLKRDAKCRYSIVTETDRDITEPSTCWSRNRLPSRTSYHYRTALHSVPHCSNSKLDRIRNRYRNRGFRSVRIALSRVSNRGFWIEFRIDRTVKRRSNRYSSFYVWSEHYTVSYRRSLCSSNHLVFYVDTAAAGIH